jgi:class 3 adenylate cyclase
VPVSVDHPESASWHVRVSDAERDAVIEQLKERTADGTLTLDEFASRVERALSARTRGDLITATEALGAVAPVPAKRKVPTHHTVVAVMSGSHTKGRWRCGRHVTAVAVMGGCIIDFTSAEIAVDEVQVTAVAVMGGIEIIVPEGIDVHMDGLPVMGGRSMRVKDVPVLPGTPRIVVHAFPIMGGVTVRSRRAKQSTTAPAEEAPPLDAAPNAVDGTTTIMFSDVSDYSGITTRLGDTAAHELLREYTHNVRSLLAKHGGHEVKAQGDGFMVAFPSVSRALRCAVQLQQSMDQRNRSSGGEEVRIHVGIHAGEVVREGNDYLGSTVIVASRLADAAGPEEILVSAVARELADGSREFGFGPPRSVLLKGFPEPRLAYPVVWADSTTTGEPPVRAEANAASSTAAVASDSVNGSTQAVPPRNAPDISSTMSR